VLTNHSDFAGYLGDICNYINPAYRMPTSTEHGNLSYGNDVTSNYSFPVVDTEDNAAGKYIFDKNASGKTIYGTFTTTDPSGSYVLPASGFRYGSDGSLGNVGSCGYYWSGSAYSSSYAYELYFDSSDASAVNYASRGYGQSVRCVLQE
jgi:uncharacterized protein (TIGR02145 family)